MRRCVLVGCVLAVLAGGTHAVAGQADPASPFAYRGVIEGFYGRPWSHAERLDAFAWMQAHGMNLYVHAPKDDPFQRANWRDPYPADAAAAMTAEASAAAAAGVSFVPNVSPGWALIPSRPAPGTAASRPLCFTCPDDLAVLVAKLRSLTAAGAQAVMVSFDDTLAASPHLSDIVEYGLGPRAAGRMHRDVLNRLRRDLGPATTIFTVLAEYSGVRDSAYLQAVRADGGLAEGIEVMWTGTGVIAPSISAADASAYAANVGRSKVLVWDNYPAHDVTGPVFGRPPSRLFLGPYEGRAPDLESGANGVVVNPMQLPRASRPALATVAAYLADPTGYDSERAWQDALAETGGDGLAALAENSRSSRLDRRESERFTAVSTDFLSALATGEWPAAASHLRVETDREGGAEDAVGVADPVLGAETAPWLIALGESADAADAVVVAMASQQPELVVAAVPAPGGGVDVAGRAAPPRLPAALATAGSAASACGQVRSSAAVTHGDRFTYLIDALYVGENRVDAFCASVVPRLLRRLGAMTPGTRVAVDVGGEQAVLGADGSFAVHLAAAPSGGEVAVSAEDDRGGRTSTSLSVPATFEFRGRS